MRNHVHFILVPERKEALVRALGRRAGVTQGTGHLFQPLASLQMSAVVKGFGRRPCAGFDAGCRLGAGVRKPPREERVVTASSDNTARLWDAAAGKEIAVLRGHDNPVWSAAFSPDGTRVVTASDDNTARLWDAAAGKEIAVLRGHDNPVWSAAFSPDGTRVVTASSDSTARLWDAATGKEIAVLRGHDGLVRLAAFSPDDWPDNPPPQGVLWGD